MFSSWETESNMQFPGLYLGKVQAIAGDPQVQPPPPDTVELGWIKVTVPAIFDQDTPEYAVWARPCFPYGHFFVPEKDDKVWIAFEGGDPRSPVWLGIWYPKGKVPDEAQAKPPKKRIIQSSKGHLIILDDTDGEEALILKDQSGNSIELRSNSVNIICKQDLTIDASGKKIVIKADSVDVQKA